MLKPDWNKSILNISATLSDYLGNKNDLPKLKVIEDALKSERKNVVFIIFDGLGVYDINSLIPNGFMQKNIKEILTSTMPATTANATTSMIDCKYPDQHLWLAWSLYSKKNNNVVDIYLSMDDYTGEKTDNYFDENPYGFYGARAKSDRIVKTIAPIYAVNGFINRTIANSVDELFEKLGTELADNSKKFIYAYCDEPDHIFHENGVNSPEGKAIVEKIQSSLEKLYKKYNDFTIIITADHGHIDIKKHIPIYEDKTLMDMLERPLSMESRFTSFKVKESKKREFQKHFNSKYSKYFDLVPSDELIKSNTFGFDNNNQKVLEFLGDYIAIGNSENASIMFSKSHTKLKGNHAGATKEELQVPLILLGR